MYEHYYGLKEPPFQLTPDPRFLYFSRSHRESYAQLTLGLRMRRGFIILSGEVGTGKTTLLRAIIRELGPDIRIALIVHTLLSARGLLQNICKEFNIDTEGLSAKSDYILRLQEFLTDLYSRGESAVLIIDEAHNLKDEILEEIRLLSNMETEDSKLLQICLSGQPELLDTLAKPQLRQLDQRISLRCLLTNLDEKETGEYIRHRLSVAGLEMLGEVFTAPAVQYIHQLTGGIPRKINILCENALVMGYVKGVKQITKEIVQAVAHEDTYQEIEHAVARKESLQSVAAGSHIEPGERSDTEINEFLSPSETTESQNGDGSSQELKYRQVITGQAVMAPPFENEARNGKGEPEPAMVQWSETVGRAMVEQFVRKLDEYILIKRPSTLKKILLVLVGFLSYILAVLISVYLLSYLNL